MADKGGQKPALRKPEFVKIKDLERGRSGYNVYVKVTKAEERQVDTKDGQKITMVDCVVADQTGSAKAFFKGEQAKGIKEGAIVAIRNGVKKIIKGHISLELDLFGRVTVENVEIKANAQKNISDEEIKFEPRRDRGGPRRGNNAGRRGGYRGDRRGEGRDNRRDERRDDRREPRDNRRDERRDDRREDREDRRDNKREDRDDRRDNRREDRDRDDKRDNRDDKRDNRRDYKRDDRRDDRREDREDRRDNRTRDYDRDYDRKGNENRGDRGDRDRQGGGRFQQKRGERGERRPMLKINEIDPGADNLRFIAKVVSATVVPNSRGNNVRCVLGDETGVVNAFLPESQFLVAGKTVALFGAEARVVKQHIEIQRARAESARNPIDKVNDKFNLSEKAWVPID